MKCSECIYLKLEIDGEGEPYFCCRKYNVIKLPKSLYSTNDKDKCRR